MTMTENNDPAAARKRRKEIMQSLRADKKEEAAAAAASSEAEALPPKKRKVNKKQDAAVAVAAAEPAAAEPAAVEPALAEPIAAEPAPPPPPAVYDEDDDAPIVGDSEEVIEPTADGFGTARITTITTADGKKKTQIRYDPEVPMNKDQLAAWRREARRVRNRESAAASRQRIRDRISELEVEVDEWKTKHAAALDRLAQLERLANGDDEV